MTIQKAKIVCEQYKIRWQKKFVLFVDDPSPEQVSLFHKVTKHNRHWGKMVTDGQHVEIRKINGDDFFVVPEKYRLGWILGQTEHSPHNECTIGLPRSHKIIITSAEKKICNLARELYGDFHRLHFFNWEQAVKDQRTSLTLIGTDLVYAKRHSILLPLFRQWEKDGISIIADGILGVELNHTNVKGRNGLADQDIVVELSQPHTSEVANEIAAEQFEFTVQDAALLYRAAKVGIMADKFNQAVGRNQGKRWRGRECIVLCDPNFTNNVA